MSEIGNARWGRDVSPLMQKEVMSLLRDLKLRFAEDVHIVFAAWYPLDPTWARDTVVSSDSGVGAVMAAFEAQRDRLMPSGAEPVMTPEEWGAARKDVRQQIRSLADDAGDGPLDADAISRYRQIMALANAILPDDDPHKITHRVVRELREFEGAALRAFGPASYQHHAAQSVRTGLAALLPPE